MKNKIRALVIASICMAATLSSVPTSINPLATTTVEAATTVKNGLYHEGSNWNYYRNDLVATDTTTLVKYNGAWWYVENGKINFNATTLCKYSNSWWYVKNGKVDFNYNGLCKYNGSWWYVRGGRVDFSARTLCKYNGTWWFVNGGRVDFNAETVCKYNNVWWYVNHGKVNFNAYGLCKYANNWWYIDNGRIDFSARTLVKYNGTWWFVENGKVNFNSGKTLCKYNGTWWYVRNGQICWKNVALMGDDFVKYNGYRYGCKNGQVDWNCKIEKVDESIWQYDTNHVIDKYTFADGSTIYANDLDDAEAGNKDCAKYLLACGQWTQEHYDEYYGYNGKFPPVIGYTNQGKPYYYDTEYDEYYFEVTGRIFNGEVQTDKIYFFKNGDSDSDYYPNVNFLK